jgi:hypothetical protein
MKTVTNVKKKAICPKCKVDGCRRHSIKEIKRYGTLYKRSVHHCVDCRTYFTLGPVLSRRYPEKFRNEVAVIASKPGMTLGKAAKAIFVRYKKKMSPSTIHDWLVEWRAERLKELMASTKNNFKREGES